ncbi:MAG: RNA methyltransferase [Firmicutes bacterium]|nr:RNA methyltransferase [Bacillota bacterium]
MEKFISSSANEIYKALKKLTTKKGRREQGLCIIEGEKIIFENLEVVEDVFVVEGKEITPNIRDLEPIVLCRKLFEEITELENGPGILASCGFNPPRPFDKGSRFLVLDRIQDSGNMGTVLRSACAFGFDTVFTIDCADPYSQKCLRAGMGNQLKINVFSVTFDEFKEFFEGLDGETSLYIADMGGVDIFGISKDVGEIVKSSFAGLVLGNEGQGVAKDFFDLPHVVVSVPMQSNVESLNVAVAGGILMHWIWQECLRGGY